MSRLAKEDSWIKTYTGKRFYPFAPRLEDIRIMDIAHSLAQSARFNGHLQNLDITYSVGQHSCHVHDLVSPRAKPWALMHDAAEAYIGDMASPIKWFFPDFCAMEDKIAAVIIERFNIPHSADIEHEVKQVDNWIVFEEGRQKLHNSEVETWQAKVMRPTTFQHDTFDFPDWTARQTRDEFLSRFAALKMEIAA